MIISREASAKWDGPWNGTIIKNNYCFLMNHIITTFTMCFKELFISLNVWFHRISSKTQKGKVSANDTKFSKSNHKTLKISENLIILNDIKISPKIWKEFLNYFEWKCNSCFEFKNFFETFKIYIYKLGLSWAKLSSSWD